MQIVGDSMLHVMQLVKNKYEHTGRAVNTLIFTPLVLLLWGGKKKRVFKNKNFKQTLVLRNSFQCGKDGMNVKVLRLLSNPEPAPLEDSW